MKKHREDVVLTERLDRGPLKGSIRVFLSNAGKYIAEYKLGTVTWQVPTSGRSAIETMENAKKWLTTSMGSR